MPRKPKTKPSIEPEAQQSDSLSTPEQSPQASQQPPAGATAASDADSNASTQAEPQPMLEGAKPAATPDGSFQWAASNPAPTPGTTSGDASQSTQNTANTDAGNVPDLPPAGDTKPFNHSHVRDRLQKHPDWKRIITTVREMRLDPKIPPKGRERFIWGEMDRLYPPILIDPKAQAVALLKTDSPQVESGNDLRRNSEAPLVREGGVKGLGDIPPTWPPLPANAVLSVELGWVQANRLYVVEELSTGATRVHLDRAHEPAPSRAAIGWLETSIRSYAKYVEVAAKVTSSGADEGEQVKRERFAIEEIRELLREMAGNPPGPGR